MRDVLRGAVGLGLALIGHVLCSRLAGDFTPYLHVFILPVLWTSQFRGEMFGAIMGSCCGLVADSLSLGVFGLSGLSMTVIGFGAGMVARKIHVLSVVRNAVFLFVFTAADLLLWSLFASLVVGRSWLAMGRLLIFRPLITALVGTAILGLWRLRRERHGR